MSSHLSNVEHFKALRLPDGRKEYERQLEDPKVEAVGFIERLDLILSCETTERRNRRVARKLREAGLRILAYKEEFYLEASRGITPSVFGNLTSLGFTHHGHCVIISGPTGVGKTFLGCVLGMEAVRKELSVRYHRTSELIERLALSRADGSHRSVVSFYRRLDLLILDDFGLAPISISASRELLEIIDARAGEQSTVFISQFPPEHFHQLLEDATAADAIMDRIIHSAVVINLTGESMRKKKAHTSPPSQARNLAPQGLRR